MLNKKDIGCEVYYPVSRHEQKCFSYLGYKSDDFPVSVKASKASLTVPVYPELTKDELEYIAYGIGSFF